MLNVLESTRNATVAEWFDAVLRQTITGNSIPGYVSGYGFGHLFCWQSRGRFKLYDL